MSAIFQCANDNIGRAKQQFMTMVIPVNMPTPNTTAINFIENVTPYIS